MTRTDPRGAPRRGPTVFGEETGYDIPNSVPDGRPAKFPHQPQPKPLLRYPGVHLYRYSGYVMARCERHAPPGARVESVDAYSRCVTCAIEGEAVAEPVAEDA